MAVLVALLALFLTPAERNPSSPLEHLPPNIEMLTYFGERADISADNQRVAFMELWRRHGCRPEDAHYSMPDLRCAGCGLPPRDALGDGRLHHDRSRPLRECPRQPHTVPSLINTKPRISTTMTLR